MFYFNLIENKKKKISVFQPMDYYQNMNAII